MTEEQNPTPVSSSGSPITPQMLRDTAAWCQSEDELRETLKSAADALEASPSASLEGTLTSLVKALRTAENELSDAWAAIHNETTEAAKAYYAQQSRHGDQLRAAEELGYERGLADGRAADPTPEPREDSNVSS